MSETLATFHLANLWCGIDVTSVREVITSPDIVGVPTASPSVAGLFNLRGQVLAAVDLRRRLGLPTGATGTAGGVAYLVEHDRAAVGLLVDKPGAVMTAPGHGIEVPDTADETIAAVVRQCYELPDGLLLVLAIDRVLDFDERRSR